VLNLSDLRRGCTQASQSLMDVLPDSNQYIKTFDNNLSDVLIQFLEITRELKGMDDLEWYI